MKLTKSNYYTQAANREYMSVSQFKAFDKCEAAAMAELNGEYKPEATTALLVGGYVDAWFEGTLESFVANNPEIVKRDGTMKADYVRADEIIKRVCKDKLFMKYMSGRKQVIKTGELFGCKWKIKMDSYHKDKIVDLKVIRTLELIMGVNFIEHWGYDIGGAVYQRIEGGAKPFYIAAVTKEVPPDIEIIHVPQYALDNALEYVARRISRILAVKGGEVEPERCGKCEYCRKTKVLTAPIDMEDVGYSTKQLKGGIN